MAANGAWRALLPRPDVCFPIFYYGDRVCHHAQTVNQHAELISSLPQPRRPHGASFASPRWRGRGAIHHQRLVQRHPGPRFCARRRAFYHLCAFGQLILSRSASSHCTPAPQNGTPLLSLHGGLAAKSPPTPVSASSIFRVASVSKVFPALLAHVLADIGALGLDDLVATRLPGFLRPRSLFTAEAGQPTLRHLMSHMAGLQREAPPGNSTPDVLSAVGASLLLAPPGASPPSYSNLGFALLGYALEGPGGAPLPALVDAHITAPLALEATGYAYTPQVLARLATGYAADGAPAPFAELGWCYAAGAMHSSAADLDALAQAALPPLPRLALSPQRARADTRTSHASREKLLQV